VAGKIFYLLVDCFKIVRSGKKTTTQARALKIFLLVILIFFFPGLRSSAFSGIRPAIKLGAGRAELFGRDAFKQTWKTFISGGLTSELLIWERLSLETGLMFVPGGSVYRLDDEETGYQETTSLAYVQVPVLAKFYLKQGNRYCLYLTAGPAVALNVKAQLEVILAGEKSSVKIDQLKGKELGLNLGAGVGYRTGPGFLLLELVFSQGLNSISKEPEEDIKNRKIFFLLGFRL